MRLPLPLQFPAPPDPGRPPNWRPLLYGVLDSVVICAALAWAGWVITGSGGYGAAWGALALATIAACLALTTLGIALGNTRNLMPLYRATLAAQAAQRRCDEALTALQSAQHQMGAIQAALEADQLALRASTDAIETSTGALKTVREALSTDGTAEAAGVELRALPDRPSPRRLTSPTALAALDAMLIGEAPEPVLPAPPEPDTPPPGAPGPGEGGGPTDGQ